MQLATPDDSPFEWMIPGVGTYHLTTKLGTGSLCNQGMIITVHAADPEGFEVPPITMAQGRRRLQGLDRSGWWTPDYFDYPVPLPEPEPAPMRPPDVLVDYVVAQNLGENLTRSLLAPDFTAVLAAAINDQGAALFVNASREPLRPSPTLEYQVHAGFQVVVPRNDSASVLFALGTNGTSAFAMLLGVNPLNLRLDESSSRVIEPLAVEVEAEVEAEEEEAEEQMAELPLCFGYESVCSPLRVCR